MDWLVPELQARGRFRTEYESTTFRGNLGLDGDREREAGRRRTAGQRAPRVRRPGRQGGGRRAATGHRATALRRPAAGAAGAEDRRDPTAPRRRDATAADRVLRVHPRAGGGRLQPRAQPPQPLRRDRERDTRPDPELTAAAGAGRGRAAVRRGRAEAERKLGPGLRGQGRPHRRRRVPGQLPPLLRHRQPLRRLPDGLGHARRRRRPDRADRVRPARGRAARRLGRLRAAAHRLRLDRARQRAHHQRRLLPAPGHRPGPRRGTRSRSTRST